MLLQTFVCVLNISDRDLLSPFSKNRSALYNQKVDCQHPAACLWWHLTAWSAGSYHCASLLVALVAWAPQQKQWWQPLALLCAPSHTKLWPLTGRRLRTSAQLQRLHQKGTCNSVRPQRSMSFLENTHSFTQKWSFKVNVSWKLFFKVIDLWNNITE